MNQNHNDICSLPYCFLLSLACYVIWLSPFTSVIFMPLHIPRKTLPITGSQFRVCTLNDPLTTLVFGIIVLVGEIDLKICPALFFHYYHYSFSFGKMRESQKCDRKFIINKSSINLAHHTDVPNTQFLTGSETKMFKQHYFVL